MNTNYVYPSAQVGELRQALLYAAGPSSYSQTTGDPVYNPGTNEYINFPSTCRTVSGNYDVTFQPTSAGLNIIRAGAPGPGQSGWTARWSFTNAAGKSGVASVAQNAAGTGMTAGTYPITFSSGAAAGTVTVSTTAVTAVVITNPGSYSSAPTATIGGSPGGTPATLTVTMSTASGEVATGANLSAETVQFGAVVSSL
jgi:hypothetical protein